jgi:sugar phosphate isomerase/epimerase
MIEAMKSTPPTFAFSTLACPEWAAEVVVERCASFGFDAIEWRGGPDGHVNPTLSAGHRTRLRRRMADVGVAALAVTAYTTFVTPERRVRERDRSELIRHLDLAADLGAGAVRAFVGVVEDPAPEEALVRRVVDGLLPAADHAAALGVAIALEPHDDFVHSERLVRLLQALDHPAVGAIWEIGNAWAAGESPHVGGPALAPWIRYVQVKDGRGGGDTWQLTGLGAGEVPLAEAIRYLSTGGPMPPISIEWERAWHPELEPAETALPQGLATIRRLVQEAARVHEPLSAGDPT